MEGLGLGASAYVSIRQHMTEYVSIQQGLEGRGFAGDTFEELSEFY